MYHNIKSFTYNLALNPNVLSPLVKQHLMRRGLTPAVRTQYGTFFGFPLKNKLAGFRSSFVLPPVFFLNSFIVSYMRHGRRAKFLKIFLQLLGYLKSITKTDGGALLNRIFFYVRLSFYNKSFTKGGRQAFSPVTGPLYLHTVLLFNYLKKNLHLRKEKLFFDRMLFELCESSILGDSQTVSQFKAHIGTGVVTRMKIHWTQNW